MNANMNAQQRGLYDAVLRGENVAVPAPAGAGRSFVIEAAVRARRAEEKVVLVTGSSGAAAGLLRQVGGETLHRGFRAQPPPRGSPHGAPHCAA